MTDRQSNLDAVLAAYEAELIRWNRQINLVSRQDTARRVADLVRQCRLAGETLIDEVLGAWIGAEPTNYFDLGSGGGLPGVVWHHQLGRHFGQLGTVLVEPREKRAWFLERLQGLAPQRPLLVWNGRWGQDDGRIAGVSAAQQVLVSLKALHLKDEDVIQGWETVMSGLPSPSGSRLVSARFYPPEQQWDESLASELGVLESQHETHDYIYRATDRRVLPPGPGGSAALAISAYAVDPS